MANDSHIVRHEDAYYPSGSYGGWSEKQYQWIQEHSTIIYHPIYDPEPKKTSWFWAMLAWVLGLLTAP